MAKQKRQKKPVTRTSDEEEDSDSEVDNGKCTYTEEEEEDEENNTEVPPERVHRQRNEAPKDDDSFDDKSVRSQVVWLNEIMAVGPANYTSH